MRKHFVAGWLVFVALSPAYAAPHPFSEARFVVTMQRGKAAYDRKDFAASEKEFHRAVELQPDSSEALNDLGQSQYRAGRFAEAQKSFQHSGRDSRAHYQAGNSLYRQNKLAEAADAYRHALRCNEQDEDARFNLQVVLDKMKAQKPKDQPDKPQEKKDKSQAQQDPSKSQPGQPQQEKGKSQAQQDPSKSQPGQPGEQRVSGPATRDDGDRILQYYQDKQSQVKRKPMAAPYPPRPSQETW